MPAWRNWQTRWTQNPVPVEGVPVRPRPPVLTKMSHRLSFLICLCNMAIVAKWLTHRIVAPALVGSIPIVRPFYWGIAKR